MHHIGVVIGKRKVYLPGGIVGWRDLQTCGLGIAAASRLQNLDLITV